MHARLSFAGWANWIEHSMNGNSFTRYLKTPKEVNTYLRRNEAADCRSEQRGTRNESLTGGFPLHRDCMGAAWRPARTVAQALGIQLQLGDGTAKGVAVHAQLARGLALVSLAVLQHRENESLLEFTHAFGIGDAVLVHLQDQSFQLIFHNAPLSFASARAQTDQIFTGDHRCRRLAWKRVGQRSATSPSLHGSAAAIPPAPPRSKRGR